MSSEHGWFKERGRKRDSPTTVVITNTGSGKIVERIKCRRGDSLRVKNEAVTKWEKKGYRVSGSYED